jgi:hypothetical protein
MPPLDILAEVDHRNLKQREFRDFEGADSFPVDFGFVVGQRHCPPHAAGQQHRVLADETLADVYEVLIDCRNRPPIFVLGFLQARFEIGNDRVAASFPDHMPNLFGLGTAHKVLSQATHNLV